MAIDTEVRLVDGQAVTVKQPLPLPEGVSDYAVGRGGIAVHKLAAPYSARALEVDAKSQVKKDEESKSRLVRLSVELGDISTSKGLSKDDIQKVVKQRLSFIELCYQKYLEKKPNIQGGITLQLAIDSSGRVTKVSLVSSKLNDKNLEQCIIQKIKELNFPVPVGMDTVTANVSLVFKIS